MPPECTQRDWSQPYERHEGLVAAFKIIYDDPEHWWDAYEMAEKLGDPFVSMRAAEARVKGEALNARLCRKGENFIYEISLVRQDGRVVKVLYDAATSQPLSPHSID